MRKFIETQNYGGYLDFEWAEDITPMLYSVVRVTFCNEPMQQVTCYLTSRIVFDPDGSQKEGLAEVDNIPWSEAEKIVGRTVSPSEINQ